MDWNNVVTQIINMLGPILATLLTALLSVDFIIIVLGTIGATHILKLLVKYAVREPKKRTIWLALTPLVALAFSWMTWKGVDRFDWVIVGFAAAPIANLSFWIGMRGLRRYAPSVAKWAQNPIMKP